MRIDGDKSCFDCPSTAARLQQPEQASDYAKLRAARDACRDTLASSEQSAEAERAVKERLVSSCLCLALDYHDKESFVLLMDAHKKTLHAIGCVHGISKPPDMQDFLQEVYLKVWTRLLQLRDRHRFSPWLRRTAENVACDWCRKNRQRTETTKILKEAATEMMNRGDEDTSDPDQPFELEELLRVIPDDCDKQIVYEHCILKRTYEHIARDINLGIGCDAVRKRCGNALVQIKDFLDQHGYGSYGPKQEK